MASNEVEPGVTGVGTKTGQLRSRSRTKILRHALKPLAAAAVLVGSISMVNAAQEQAQSPQILRDAEIESALRLLSAPIFQAAGLAPDSVRITVLSDRAADAYAVDRGHLRITTGMLLQADTPDQLVGVIAHDAAHMAMGHLPTMVNRLRYPRTISLLKDLVGLAAIAGDVIQPRNPVQNPNQVNQRPDYGLPLLNQELPAEYPSFSLDQEISADETGLRYLEETHQSPDGFLKFMESLAGQEMQVSSRQTSYVRSHPLNGDRLAVIRKEAERSPWRDQPPSPQSDEAFHLLQAKLFALGKVTPARTVHHYPETDTSIAARYARAITAYRKPDVPGALALMDSLIADRPKYPYFHEMRGQMLFGNGQNVEAAGEFTKALTLTPGTPLFEMELGQVEIEENDPALLRDAKTQLTAASKQDPENPMIWHLLGVAYGISGDEGKTAFALAQEAVLTGDKSKAAFLTEKAQKLLPAGDPLWLQLDDLKSQAIN